MALDGDRLQKPAKKLRKLLNKMPGQPSPEEVHDLRSNIRRLEATLAALLPCAKRNDKRLLKDLGQVRKRAGKVRDMDVLTAFAADVHSDGEEECRVQLLEYLGVKRQKSARNLNRTVGQYGPPARRRLKKTLVELEQIVSQKSQNRGANDAAAQATASALRLESELAAVPRLGRSNLHPYRLQVKELHNILKLAEGADSQEFTETLGKVKDAIGEWHNWEELTAIAQNTLDHSPRCKLVTELKRITGEKLRHALEEAERMRRKYFHISPGRKDRRPAEPAEAVWTATKAIAA
jgi:CHAD domain-containing protein